mgnify:CR=1 FL=1
MCDAFCICVASLVQSSDCFTKCLQYVFNRWAPFKRWYAIRLHALSPTLAIQCVELESEVLEVARKYFELATDGRLCTVNIADAHEFVGRAALTGDRFDIVIVDCFGGDGIAPAVSEGSLLRQLDSCLSPSGLCVVNTVWGGTSGARGEVASRLKAVLAERFDAVYEIETRSASRNIILLAHQGEPCGDGQWRAMLTPMLCAQGAAAMCPDVTSDRFPQTP